MRSFLAVLLPDHVRRGLDAAPAESSSAVVRPSVSPGARNSCSNRGYSEYREAAKRAVQPDGAT